MKRNPRVSVIIPTYNRAAWLLQAVSSVTGQSFSDFELIIADDGSTDNTAEVVSQVEHPLHYVHLSHSGRPAVARNRALEIARGDLVAFLDDDDLWMADKLQKQVAIFDENPALALVYCDVRMLVEPDAHTPPILSPAQKRPERLFDSLLVDCFIYPSTVMARRSRLLAIGGFDESLSITEDYDLWLRLAYGSEAGCVPEALVILRRHEEGISTLRKREIAEGMIFVLMRVWRELKLTGRQRFLLRRSLSRSHTHLAMILRKEGAGKRARRHLWRAIFWFPLRRRAWLELLPRRAMS